ncbi:ROK family protein [Victivallis vadensis]|uniref:ROK family protein n=1 Tax=Victivallis vadensis TaxID=172901 RepID=UPI001D990D61|nr:ROK family protein [Victivallis vadensis]
MEPEFRKSGNGGNSPRDVLRLLFECGPLGQVAAAGLLGITKAACNLHFQRLTADGFIEPAEISGSGRGRPAQTWRVRSGNCFLGMTLQHSGIFAELIDFNASSRFRKNIPLEPNVARDGIRDRLRALWEEAKMYLLPEERLLQCFIGVPGAIAVDGTILNSPNFPVLNGWNLDRFALDCGIACYTDTIGLAVIRGETCGIPVDTVAAILDWSEGFGVTFAQNGQRLLFPAPGSRRYHGLWDFGHIRYKLNGRRCYCGKAGCLEAYIGGVALLEQHLELPCRTVKQLVELLRSGHSEACGFFADAVRIMTEALYPALELLGVEVIILCGTLRDAFEVFRPKFQNALEKFYTPEEIGAFSIRSGGESFPTLSHGAALTARQYFLSPEVIGRYRGLGQSVLQNSNQNQ